jgi:sugar phosphate isomerase/epimerase
MPLQPTRRGILAAATAAILAPDLTKAAPATASFEPFGYCLNTATIQGQNLPLMEEIELAAKAGYGAIEPWVRELEKHQQSGKALSDIKKSLSDHGLKMPSAIGFAEWIVDDESRRAAGLKRMAADMALVAEAGGTRIAAPPAGLQPAPATVPDLPTVAERFAVVLELGKQAGVTPQLELWGFARVLSRLGEVAYVGTECSSPDAKLLLDVFHLYKGGSNIDGIALLNGSALGVLHVNDYPTKPRDQIKDSMRVYPGDGVAPLAELFRSLKKIGYDGYLSVELFNRDYWRQSPQKVAQIALDKTRATVQKAFS